MIQAAIGVRNVVKRFGSHVAVADLSLSVVPGDCVVILGSSGCGKTTLLRLIAGLEKPDAGEVWLNGALASSTRRLLMPPHARQIGFVFQDLALWPHLTVRGNLDFVLAATGVRSAEREQRITEVLKLVRAEGFIKRYPAQLCGGEQQRVALARTLVGTPALLLLDEPLSSLDADFRSGLRDELAAVRRRLALTTIYVTHDAEDAAVLADRVVDMRAGRIVSTREVPRKEGRA